MNKLLVLIFLVFVSSCKKGNVSFELLNKEVVSKHIQLDSLEFSYHNKKFNNEKELYEFTNQVEFKVTNNSENKYLFYLNSLKLNEIYNLDIIIEDENKKVINKSTPLIDGSYNCKIGSLLELDFYNKNEKEKLLQKIGCNIKSNILEYYDEKIIISPNETHVFQTTISLPFVIEDNEENLRRPIYFKLDPSKKYTFKLKYKLKENLEKILSKEILKNLKDNNIEIFKGEIETQKIPIKFK
jgi:hypothetical protein